MHLLVIRHAEAGSREKWAATGEDDALRPLTSKGERRMKVRAKALARFVPTLDALAASPLLRARQTAEIVARRYDGLEIATTDTLLPHHPPSRLLTWLRKQEGDTVAIVGHEPHLGVVVTWLVAGLEEPRIELEKGAACLLDLGERPGRARATLSWALTATQLQLLEG